MILEKARALGVALSESEEFSHMASARAALEENEAVSAMLSEYQQKQEQIIELLSADEMDRQMVATLSSDVEVLQGQLMENPLFMEAIEAQNTFQQLMTNVNREIGVCIGVMPHEHADGCSHDCGSCGGCH